MNTRARFNVFPTTTIDTIVGQKGQRRLVPMRWGLVPSWWSKSLKELKLATFNARAETVTQKPFFRGAFKRNRCLIPVSGYYEWQDTPGGKQPWYFTSSDGSPALTIAGLWDEWQYKETGIALKSCTMIITEPNTLVAEVHDRMPVLLSPDHGFRIMARRDGAGVRLFTRNGTDFTARFPLTAAAVAALPAHSFLIDGEARLGSHTIGNPRGIV